MAIKRKMKKKPASTIGLNNNKPQDVKSIENLKELAEVLPGCSDITSALRYLCEYEAPRAKQRFLSVLKTA